MLVTQSRGHSSQKNTLLPPTAPSSPSRAGFHQPTGANSTNFSLFFRKQSGKDFSTALLPLRHLEMLFPIFLLQYQALGSRMLQNKTCEKVLEEVMVLWKMMMDKPRMAGIQ